MAQKKSPKTAASKPATPRKSGATKPRATRAVSRKATKPIEDVRVMPCTEAQVRERAYYIFMERQGSAGDALSDWLRAERELNETRTTPGG